MILSKKVALTLFFILLCACQFTQQTEFAEIFVPTATAVDCFYTFADEERVNETFTPRLQAVLTAVNIEFVDAVIIDDAWEALVCGEEVRPHFDTCYVMRVEIDTDSGAIPTDEELSLISESIYAAIENENVCGNFNPNKLEIYLGRLKVWG